jgi:hypothetical protein
MLALTDDVLSLGVSGELGLSTLMEMFDSATKGRSPSGPEFGALLLDVTEASPTWVTVGLLALLWRKRMPRRPCAVLHGEVDAAYWRALAMRLALSAERPTVMVTFTAADRPAAVRWCQSSAVTYRFELARAVLLRTPASSPDASG